MCATYFEFLMNTHTPDNVHDSSICYGVQVYSLMVGLNRKYIWQKLNFMFYFVYSIAKEC